jgi:hypothetical protein
MQQVYFQLLHIGILTDILDNVDHTNFTNHNISETDHLPFFTWVTKEGNPIPLFPTVWLVQTPGF